MTTTRYLLAGDVGGTKTHLGLFDAATLAMLETRTFASADFSDLPAMLRSFFWRAGAALPGRLHWCGRPRPRWRVPDH